MNAANSTQIASRYRWWAALSGGFAVAVGVSVCLGWLLDLRVLQRLHPALVAMKFNAAVALVLLGGALRLRLCAGPRCARIARALAVAAGTLGVASALEWALHVDLGIDELVCRDPASVVAAGRMAPVTAVCLLTLGAAVAWIESSWAEWAALLVGLLAEIAILGYAYDPRDPNAVGPHTSLALHTALALAVLALGVLLARPERGRMQLLTTDLAGGVLARGLVPAALVVPPVLGLLRQWGEQAGLYGTALGRALLVTANGAIFVYLVLRAAVALSLADRRRRTAEDRLRALADVSHAFAKVATNHQALLDQIAGAAAELVGDGCLVTLISDDGERMVNAANAHRDPALALAYQTFVAATTTSLATSTSISATVARTGKAQRAEVSPAGMVARTEEALRPIVARLNVHGFAVVPIRVRETVIGTLSLLRSQPGHSYTEDDVTLMQDLADRAGLAIENARLYDKLDERVRERTTELQAVNEQLESFGYSVAHDLRAPLRAISGYGQALVDDYAGRLDATGLHYLDGMRNAAHRMGRLIDDLLNLSRIERAELHREPVDLSALAEAVLERLRAAEPGRVVETMIQPGLVVRADPRLLEIVLTNLLGNAWKFTGKREHARVELAVQTTGASSTYVVRDNGAGFDPAYAGKLFGVFQRLHTERDFEGTGIGLAIVHRIIHRHGGQIRAEGELNQGAAVFFTLEASPA